MTRSRCLLAAFTMSFPLGAACTPSGSAARAPRAGADSATELAQEAPSGELPVAGDVTTEPAPDAVAATRPPRGPIAARPIPLPRPTGPYQVRVVDEGHHDLPTFVSGGRTYVMGTVGSRYSIVVANPTPRRVEAVLSIDGLDAVDGHPANYVEKRGYILPAYGDATIDGFRTSVDDVATFRFSSVADSYAGRLGQARDVGVIGVAFFPERAPVTVREPSLPLPAPTSQTRRPRHVSPPRSAPVDDLASESSGAPAAPQAAAPSGAGGAPTPSPRAEASQDRAGATADAPAKRPGLGTEFGEARESRIELTEFARANATRPRQVVAIRYNDRAGLVALGVIVPQPYVAAESELRVRESADPFRENRFAQPPP